MESYRPNRNQEDEHEREDEFLRERMRSWKEPERARPYGGPFDERPRKSKFVAGLLSFIVPGTGQLYLGFMQRGIALMLILILDICAIVAVASGAEVVPLIVLFSLLIPVIYFYNVFDALQLADRINGRGAMWGGDWSGDGMTGNDPLSKLTKGSGFGYLLLAAGAIIFLMSSRPIWLTRLYDIVGSSIGAIVLIVLGIYLLFRESRKK